MLVCQVANYSPICIDMSLSECGAIDNKLLKAYHYKLKCMTHDAKHHIFISQKRGGIGVRSFTREYIGALMRDIEVEISNPSSLSAHSLCASLEAAIEKELWLLHQQSVSITRPLGGRSYSGMRTHIGKENNIILQRYE